MDELPDDGFPKASPNNPCHRAKDLSGEGSDMACLARARWEWTRSRKLAYLIWSQWRLKVSEGRTGFLISGTTGCCWR